MENCLRENCDPHGECERECHEQGEGIFDECMDEIDNEEECNALRREFVEECLDEHCDPPGSCQSECSLAGQAVFQECVDAGGEPPECNVLRREFVEECLALCEG